MKPDIIMSNPPYGKVGVEITNYLMACHKDSQMAILGTKGMFNKHYRTVALEYVQVGEYQYDPKGGKTRRLDWGVQQAILLAWHRKGKTWTEVISRQTVYGGGCIRLHSKRASSIVIKYAISGGSVGRCLIEKCYNTNNVPVFCSIVLPVSKQCGRGICSSRTIHVCTEQELPQIEHIK